MVTLEVGVAGVAVAAAVRGVANGGAPNLPLVAVGDHLLSTNRCPGQHHVRTLVRLGGRAPPKTSEAESHRHHHQLPRL